MTDVPQTEGNVLTADETTSAVLAHVLQLVGGWIAPLVIFLVKRKSRFVSFHALQALLLQGLYFILAMVIVCVVMVLVMTSVITHPAVHDGLPPAIVLLFPVIWLGMMGWWVFMLVVAILYGVKAGRGEWAEYPLLGRLARNILKIGPNGTVWQG